MSGRSQRLGIGAVIVIVVVLFGGATAGVGMLIQTSATTVGVDQTADALGDAIAPTETVGQSTTEIVLDGGIVRTEPRHVRIFPAASTELTSGVTDVDVSKQLRSDAIIYDHPKRHVIVHAGAVLHEVDGVVQVQQTPRILAGDPEGPRRIGVPEVSNDKLTVSLTGQTTVQIHTTVRHQRTNIGVGEYYLAIETGYPEVWEEYFTLRSPTVVTTHARFEGDEEESVIVRLPRQQTTVLRHTLDLEVTPK